MVKTINILTTLLKINYSENWETDAGRRDSSFSIQEVPFTIDAVLWLRNSDAIHEAALKEGLGYRLHPGYGVDTRNTDRFRQQPSDLGVQTL